VTGAQSILFAKGWMLLIKSGGLTFLWEPRFYVLAVALLTAISLQIYWLNCGCVLAMRFSIAIGIGTGTVGQCSARPPDMKHVVESMAACPCFRAVGKHHIRANQCIHDLLTRM
jgi:hypothetical protein